MKIAMIGVGGLGGAVAAGVLASGQTDVVLCGRRPGSLESFADRARVIYDATVAVEGADVVVLAVKPKGTPALAAALAPRMAPGALLVSCAAGVPVAAFPADVATARAMPNIGALRGQSTTAIFLGQNAQSDSHRASLHQIFSAVGSVREVADEQLLHPVTAAASSSPAWFLLAAEALVDAAVEHGIRRDDALFWVRGGLVATAARLDEGVEPLTLRAQVTSPAGTTAAGLMALEQAGLRGAFRNAMAAAATRSKALEEAGLKGS